MLKIPRLYRAVLGGATVLFALFGHVSNASAQAWVDIPGSVFTGANYTYGFSNELIETSGEPVFEGVDTINHSLLLTAEYVPIERLGISINVPIMMMKYKGDTSLLLKGHGDYDDGSGHVVLQDFKAVARYQLFGPFHVVTPHIGFTIPMTNYETQGFAAAGRHLKQLHAGVSAGMLPSFLPRLFLHARYEFSLSEGYGGDDDNFENPGTAPTDAERDTLSSYGRNTSELDFQVGYLITDALQASLGVHAHWDHGGVAFEGLLDQPPIVFDYHDPLLDEDLYLLSAGARYQITDTLSTSLSLLYFLSGENTSNAKAVSLGFGYQIR